MDKNSLADISLFILRLAIGIIFVMHGAQKLFGAFGGPGVEGLSGMMQSLGFTPPILWAWIVAITEGLGGLFLILGVLPRISAGLIGIVMLVAIISIHGSKGYFMMNGGFEYQLFILMACVSIILAGAGRVSLYNRW